jgi:hypothetical protein
MYETNFPNDLTRWKSRLKLGFVEPRVCPKRPGVRQVVQPARSQQVPSPIPGFLAALGGRKIGANAGFDKSGH